LVQLARDEVARGYGSDERREDSHQQLAELTMGSEEAVFLVAEYS
jgi:hypothetical protein